MPNVMPAVGTPMLLERANVCMVTKLNLWVRI
jgi:hypothetical protein